MAKRLTDKTVALPVGEKDACCDAFHSHPLKAPLEGKPGGIFLLHACGEKVAAAG